MTKGNTRRTHNAKDPTSFEAGKHGFQRCQPASDRTRARVAHLRTRCVHFAGCTPQPDARWIQQQARNFSLVIAENTAQPSHLIHDRDGAFRPPDEVLRSTGIKVIKTPPQSPMCNAYAERFVRETRETLDNLILLGEQHFRHVLKQIEHHHNRQRPHQGWVMVSRQGLSILISHCR